MFPKLQKLAKHTSKKIIDKHIEYINEILDKINPDIVTIEGGEVGHIPEYILEYFFERVNRKIEVSTNGQFLRREYHKNEFIRPKIKKIMLHIADKIDNNKIELDYDIIDDDILIECGIVDINKDPKRIREFIISNDHIDFKYIDYDSDILGDGFGLDEVSYLDLYDAIKDLENVSSIAKERIIKKHKLNERRNIKTNQDMCQKLHPCVFIDLVNETIPLCIRNYLTVYTPLNYENLCASITETGIFDYSNSHCSNCFRICQDEGINISQIRNRSLYKKRLR